MLSIKNPFTPYKIVRLNERTRSKDAEQTLADYFFAFFTFDQTSVDSATKTKMGRFHQTEVLEG